MGAMVLPGGRPSGALRRRVRAAVAAASGRAGARFLVTGGVGQHPPSEARVMCQLLIDEGIAPAQIVLEETGTDTLSSLVACARLLRATGAGEIFVCSDRYHVPRCRAVLRALGIRAGAVAAPAPAPARAGGTMPWLWARAREVAGLPWDVALALLARARSRG
jgi:vancomycin permeability regulator SanA